MPISARDLQITFTLLLVVFGLNLFAGMAGLADDSLEREPPTLNLSTGQFDFARDFPDSPGSPDEGTLEWSQAKGGNTVNGVSQFIIDRPVEDGATVELVNRSDGFFVQVVDYNSSQADPNAIDRYEINDSVVGEEIFHRNASSSGWVITFTVNSLENHRQPNMTAEVDFKIEASPSDQEGGLGSLPVIGGLFDAGEQLVSMLGWLGLVIRWAATSFIEAVLNAFVVMYNAGSWAIGFLGYLFGGATAVASAPDAGWAKTIAHLPLVALSLMMLKIAIGIVEASDWL